MPRDLIRIAQKSHSGEFDLHSYDNPDQVIEKNEVGDIWKNSSKYGKWCREHGIMSAWDFSNTNTKVIQEKDGFRGLTNADGIKGKIMPIFRISG